MRANTQFEKPIVPETLLKIETATSGGSFLSILFSHTLSLLRSTRLFSPSCLFLFSFLIEGLWSGID